MTEIEQLKREIYHLGIAREQILLSYNTDNEEKVAEIERLRAELAQIHTVLESPNFVALNMRHGTIAWTEESLYSVLGRTPAIHLLKKLEWSATAWTRGGYTVQACPFCKGSYRHGPNCELDKMVNPAATKS